MKDSRWIGLAVIILGVLTLFVLIPLGVASPGQIDTLALAPKFWPIIIASVFTLTGVILTIMPGGVDEESQTDVHRFIQRIPRLATLLAALFGFYFLAPYIGMVFPTMLLILGLSWFAGEDRWKLMIPVSLIVPVVLTSFFILVANIPIPLGILEFVYG